MIPKFEGNPGIIPNPGRESISAEEEEDVIPIIWAAPIWEQGRMNFYHLIPNYCVIHCMIPDP